MFKLDSRNPLRQKKLTYKCINKYKKKDKPEILKYFCDSTIVAIRDAECIKKFKYFFHSDCCNKYYEKINEDEEKKKQNIIYPKLKVNTEIEKSLKKEDKNNYTKDYIENYNENKFDLKHDGNDNSFLNNCETITKISKEKINKLQVNTNKLIPEIELNIKNDILS